MAGTKVPSRSRSRSRSRSLGPSPSLSPNQGEVAEHAEEPLEFGLAAFAGLRQPRPESEDFERASSSTDTGIDLRRFGSAEELLAAVGADALKAEQVALTLAPAPALTLALARARARARTRTLTRSRPSSRVSGSSAVARQRSARSGCGRQGALHWPTSSRPSRASSPSPRSRTPRRARCSGRASALCCPGSSGGSAKSRYPNPNPNP